MDSFPGLGISIRCRCLPAFVYLGSGSPGYEINAVAFCVGKLCATAFGGEVDSLGPIECPLGEVLTGGATCESDDNRSFRGDNRACRESGCVGGSSVSGVLVDGPAGNVDFSGRGVVKLDEVAIENCTSITTGSVHLVDDDVVAFWGGGSGRDGNGASGERDGERRADGAAVGETHEREPFEDSLRGMKQCRMHRKNIPLPVCVLGEMTGFSKNSPSVHFCPVS